MGAAAAMVAAADLHAPFWEKGPPEGVVRCSDQQSWLCLIKEKSMSVFRRERAAGRSGFMGGDAEDIGEFIHSNADAISFSLTQAPQTLAHCDYRAGNLMREKGGLGIKVLDWQTFTYGPGLYDVANIVVCSMTVTECEKHSSACCGCTKAGSRSWESSTSGRGCGPISGKSPPPRCRSRFCPRSPSGSASCSN